MIHWVLSVQVVPVVLVVQMVLVVQKDQADLGFLSLQDHQAVQRVLVVLVGQIDLVVQQVPRKKDFIINWPGKLSI